MAWQAAKWLVLVAILAGFLVMVVWKDPSVFFTGLVLGVVLSLAERRVARSGASAAMRIVSVFEDQRNRSVTLVLEGTGDSLRVNLSQEECTPLRAPLLVRGTKLVVQRYPDGTGAVIDWEASMSLPEAGGYRS